MIAKLGEWQYGNETTLGKLLKEAPFVAELVDRRQVVVGQVNGLGGACDHCVAEEFNTGVQRYAKIVWVEE